MRIPLALALAALASTVSPSATAQGDESVGGHGAPVVYGDDDRMDWYQVDDSSVRLLGRESVVAVVSASDIAFGSPSASFPPFAPGSPTLDEYITFSEGIPLCDGERFAEQPAVAVCSGTLIARDVVLTAGHCFRDEFDCESQRLVFDYFYSADGTLETIDEDDVYRCRTILAREERSAPHLDYAVIQLDRRVVGRRPARVRRADTALTRGTPVTILGFGTGLPMKIDRGGEITDANGAILDTFSINTDTFAGNSGAGIFDSSGRLVGILVTGQLDYVEDEVNACIEVNRLPNEPGGEQATYAFHAIDALCAAHGGHPLCDEGGCSCTTGGRTSAPGAGAAALALGMLPFLRRRRSRG